MLENKKEQRYMGRNTTNLIYKTDKCFITRIFLN